MEYLKISVTEKGSRFESAGLVEYEIIGLLNMWLSKFLAKSTQKEEQEE